MTKHRNPAEFEQPAKPPCRVAEMARRFGVAEKEWCTLDNSPEIDLAGAAVAYNNLVMQTLTDAAALEQPTSPLGALFQVLIISREAHAMRDCVDASSMREHMIRSDSALWGIRRFLETKFGISADEIGGQYMMAEDVSYHGKLSTALAGASKQPASAPQLHVAN